MEDLSESDRTDDFNGDSIWAGYMENADNSGGPERRIRVECMAIDRVAVAAFRC